MKNSGEHKRVLISGLTATDINFFKEEFKELKLVEFESENKKIPAGINCLISRITSETPELLNKLNTYDPERAFKLPVFMLENGNSIAPKIDWPLSELDIEFIAQPYNIDNFRKLVYQKISVFSLQKELALARQEVEFLQRKNSNNEHRLNILSATVNEPIVFVNNEFQIKFWNKEAENVFGYSKFEVISEDIFRCIIATRSQQQITEIFNLALKKINRTFNTDHSFFVKTKHKVEFETDASISAHSVGKDSYNIVIVFHDIQKSKKLEKEITRGNELKEENKLLREFIHTVSHDLRTPMNAILGIAKTLMKYNSSNLTDKQREGLDIIYQSGSDLVNLIRDLLDLIRMERGKFELNNEYFDFDKMLALQKTQVLHLLGNKAIKFSIRKSTSIPPILVGDYRKIGQILTNLLTNAVKYTHAGKIVLSTHIINNKLFFEIADTGIGISEDKLTVITNKFEQAEPSFIANGVGLGLNISARLVQMMQGEMTFESVLGKGTIVRFYVSLPDGISIGSIQPGGKHDKDEFEVYNYSDRKKLIVAIDDSEQNAYIYSLVSESEEYAVILAKNGKTGLNAIAHLNPDIILLKLEVSELHGATLIRILHRLKHKTPILAITDYENYPMNLPSEVNLLLQPFTVQQVSEKLKQFELISPVPQKVKVCFVFEETSKFKSVAKPDPDFLFIQNKNPELSLIQINRSDFDFIVFEQAARLKNSELILKIIETELYKNFKTIVLLIDGQQMKYLSNKIGNCSNIRIMQSSDFKVDNLK